MTSRDWALSKGARSAARLYCDMYFQSCDPGNGWPEAGTQTDDCGTEKNPGENHGAGKFGTLLFHNLGFFYGLCD